MKKLCVAVLGAVLLAFVVMPVVNGSRYHPEPAEAQGGPIETAIGVACLGLTGGECILLWGAVVYFTGTAYYMGITIPSSPTELVNEVKDWLLSGSTGANQFISQYEAHPYTCNLTSSILGDWQTIAETLGLEGWSWVSNWHGEGIVVWERAMVAAERVVMRTPNFYFATGANCLMLERSGHNPIGPGGPDGAIDGLDFVKVPSGERVNVGHHTSRHLSYDDLGWGGNLSEPTCTALLGEYGYWELTLPDPGQNYGTSGTEYVADAMMTLEPWVDGTNPIVDVNFGDFGLVGSSYEELIGLVAHAPLNPDAAAAKAGDTDMPRADGTDGPYIDEAAGETALPMPQEDKRWWEGLFGGLTGPLGGIKEALDGIATHVADIPSILSQVTELPTVMVEALTAAVVPNTDQLRSNLDDLGGTLEVKAPFSFLFAFYDALPNLFTGGTGCVDIDMHTDDVGWQAYTMNMCIPAEAGTITKAVSRVVAVVLMLFYAVSTARGMIGIDNQSR